MGNSGKNLELLVKKVEEILLPEGFRVESREKIFNDEGVQVAELDVLISGKLSTTEIQWLIECRDRPSEGSAPTSWIEQLVGRRDRLKLNKVTAVSTTGFSPGAIDYAREAGIEIRTVKDVSREEVADWLSIPGMVLVEQKGDLLTAHIFAHNATQEQLNELGNLLQNFKTRELVFVHTGTGDKLSLMDVWRDGMNQFPDLFDEIVPGSEPTQKSLSVNYVNPNSRYMIALENSMVHIERIDFRANLSIKKTDIPISKITKYSTDLHGDTIAETVHFVLEVENSNVDLAIHKVNDREGSKIFVSSTKPAKLTAKFRKKK